MFNPMFPRLNALDRERRVAHYDKFLAHVQRLHVSFDHAEDLPRVIEALQAGDLHLNSIPLRSWDAYHSWYAPKSRGLCWSYADTVCTAKLAALVSALKTLCPPNTPLATGESIQQALEALESAE